MPLASFPAVWPNQGKVTEWNKLKRCIQVEWPGKGRSDGGGVPKGYVYVVLEGEGAVPALLSQVV